MEGFGAVLEVFVDDRKRLSRDCEGMVHDVGDDDHADELVK